MKRFFRKLDNRGVSLVFTMLAILVVLILASLILSLSLSNFQSKAVDNMSRENFYSVEQAANEMYAGIGSYAIDILGSAYASSLSSVTMKRLDGTITQVETDKLNIFFREEYMKNIIQYMTGKTINATEFFNKDANGNPAYGEKDAVVYYKADDDNESVFTNALTRLKQCLTKSDGVTVSIDGDISFDYQKFVLILGDVHVEYEEKGLLSRETFDMEIGFPAWNLTFLANRATLGDDYTNFVLVGDTGLEFNASATTKGGIFGGGTAKTKAGMNTGLNGITIRNVSVTASPNSDGTGGVVSSGDITIRSTVTNGSSFQLTGGKLWCNNIVIPSNGSGNEDKAANVTFNSGSKVYVKDDLEIYGDNASVTISGEYQGYSLVGYSNAVGNEADGLPNVSSSIIINGNKDTVTISGGANVNLAGNAYINVVSSESTAYMTGESIALKTNQQAYMVPSDYMKEYSVGTNTRKLSNPAPTTMYNEADGAIAGSKAEKFVAMDSIPIGVRNLLNAENPIVKKYDHSKYYFYFNFSTKENAATFIKNYSTLLGDKAANLSAAVAGSTGGSGTSTGSQSRIIVNNGTGDNMTSLKSVGAVATSNGSAVDFRSASPATETVLATNQTNYGNRFELMAHLLIDIPDESRIIYDKRIEGEDGRKLDLQLFSAMPTRNYVNENELTYQNGTNEVITVPATDGSSDTCSVHVIYTTDDLEVNGSLSGTYLIVALGNVTVKTDFTGLIMSEKTIMVDSNATLTAAPETIRKFLERDPKSSDGKRVNQVFENYRVGDENDNDDINRLQYSDVLELSNWRKY